MKYSVTQNVFFLVIRRPPRSTLDRSSAASDVYKRQHIEHGLAGEQLKLVEQRGVVVGRHHRTGAFTLYQRLPDAAEPVSYTHLRAHETVLDLVCRLLLEQKTRLQVHANANISHAS